jgi:hypothetical protein
VFKTLLAAILLSAMLSAQPSRAQSQENNAQVQAVAADQGGAQASQQITALGGLDANKPKSLESGSVGVIYLASDTGKMYQWSGTSWTQVGSFQASTGTPFVSSVAPSAQTANVSQLQAAAETPTVQPKKQRRVFTFTDDNVSWMYGTHFVEPYAGHGPTNNIANLIPKNGIDYQHIDGGNKYGDNFLDITLLIANKQNSVSVAYFHSNPANGSMDFYTTFRHDIFPSRLFNTKPLSFGPIADVALTVGADIAAKNDDFSNERKSPMVGPSIIFKAPNHGVIKVSAMWTREWNEEGTDITSWGLDGYPKTWGKQVTYDPTYTIQAVWHIPFAVGRVPLTLRGFGVFNGSKGHNAGTLPAPGAQVVYQGTKPETLLAPELMWTFGNT